MEETPKVEFELWKHYWETEDRRPTLDQYYLAAIVAEIRSLFKEHRVPVEDALVRFERREKLPKRPMTEEEARRRIEYSKAAWGAFLGGSAIDERN